MSGVFFFVVTKSLEAWSRASFSLYIGSQLGLPGRSWLTVDSRSREDNRADAVEAWG